MKWISVKDRFPTKEEHEKGILVWFDDGSKIMGIQPSYAPIGPTEPYEYNGPSHWMLAPNPPKSNTKKMKYQKEVKNEMA